MSEADFPSFADFEEPNFDSVGEEPAASEPKVETKPEPAAVPQGPQGANFFENLAAFDAQKEQARLAREEQMRRAEENRARWEKMYEPPAPPVEKDKLVLEPDALLGYIQQNQKWTADMMRAHANAMAQMRNESYQYAAQMRAEAALAAQQMSRVTNSVAGKLRAEGFEDEQIEALLTEADQALATDPNRYLDYRTSPQHFEGAVRFMASQRGAAPVRHAEATQRPVAFGPTLPYNSSAPTSASAALPSGMTREDIARAQRAFGVKIDPKRLAQAGRVVV